MNLRLRLIHNLATEDVMLKEKFNVKSPFVYFHLILFFSSLLDLLSPSLAAIQAHTWIINDWSKTNWITSTNSGPFTSVNKQPKGLASWQQNYMKLVPSTSICINLFLTSCLCYLNSQDALRCPLFLRYLWILLSHRPFFKDYVWWMVWSVHFLWN